MYGMFVNSTCIKADPPFGKIRCDICGKDVEFGIPGAELSMRHNEVSNDPDNCEVEFRYACYDCTVKYISEQNLDSFLSYGLNADAKEYRNRLREKYKNRWDIPGVNSTFSIQVACFCKRYNINIFDSRIDVPTRTGMHGGVFFIKHNAGHEFNTSKLGVNSYTTSFMYDGKLYSLFMQDKRWDLKHKYSICPSNQSMLCLTCPFNSYDGSNPWEISKEVNHESKG